MIGCGHFGTAEGLCTDSPAADVDSQNIVSSRLAQAHVPSRAFNSADGHLRECDINIKCWSIAYHVGGVPRERIVDGAILASNIPIYGAKDASRGSWFDFSAMLELSCLAQVCESDGRYGASGYDVR